MDLTLNNLQMLICNKTQTNIYSHTLTHTHTHIYIYMYICYRYVKKVSKQTNFFVEHSHIVRYW